MTTADHSPLGKTTAYRGRYDPSLLFPIPRAPKRADLDLPPGRSMHGVDVWNAYELSWLDPRGKPQVALAEFRVPADSPNIIESKSFKLYLNGFAGERRDVDALQDQLHRDLSAAAGADVDVRLIGAGAFAQQALAPLAGTCIDDQDIAIDCYGPPDAGFLHAQPADDDTEELWVSHLLKSNCPVTGQPDWGSVQIACRGARLDREGLLRYLVSFREHNDFHEQCVERIFADILRRCAPAELSVYARYTRRGGLDINPFRSTRTDVEPPNPRGARQ